MKFFFFAAGSSLPSLGTSLGQPLDIISPTSPTLTNRNDMAILRGSIVKGLKNKPKPTALQIQPRQNDFDMNTMISSPEIYPAWAITNLQKQLLDEFRNKGFDVTLAKVIQEIREKAIEEERKTNNLKARKVIFGSKLRHDVDNPFSRAIDAHSSAMNKRIEIENRIESTDYPPAILATTYLRALRAELVAGRELQMERINEYPKSGFHSHAWRE
jgi:hypothetical protein